MAVFSIGISKNTTVGLSPLTETGERDLWTLFNAWVYYLVFLFISRSSVYNFLIKGLASMKAFSSSFASTVMSSSFCYRYDAVNFMTISNFLSFSVREMLKFGNSSYLKSFSISSKVKSFILTSLYLKFKPVKMFVISRTPVSLTFKILIT